MLSTLARRFWSLVILSTALAVASCSGEKPQGEASLPNDRGAKPAASQPGQDPQVNVSSPSTAQRVEQQLVPDLGGLEAAAISAIQQNASSAYFLEAMGRSTRLSPYYQGRSAEHSLKATFDSHGLTLQRAEVLGATPFTLQLGLTAFGTSGGRNQVSLKGTKASKNRIEYQRDRDLTEWYLNGPLGVEHGFTIQAPPEGQRGGLELVVSVAGLTPKMLSADSVALLDVKGTEVAYYSRLHATDATGKVLPSRSEVRGQHITLVVDDREAQYPVVVDPLVSTTQVAKLLALTAGGAADSEANAGFGRAVAIEGNYAVIGAPFDDGPGSNAGNVYIFFFNTTWGIQAVVNADTGSSNNAEVDANFGSSVAISGTSVAVGAPLENGGGGVTDRGNAYIFLRAGTTWDFQARLTASDDAIGDNCGTSVAIDTDTLAVGCRNGDGTVTNSGSVYIWTRVGTAWTQRTELTAGADSGANDEFGNAVALSGGTLVVGAHLNDDTATSTGSVYVFTGSAATWTQQAKLVASDAVINDEFGYSVALSGDYALIGSPGVTDATKKGAAYVFFRNGTTWGQQQKLTASDGVADDDFGTSVALASDTAIVGAPLRDDVFTNAGAAYVYARSGTTWSQEAKLLASDGAAALTSNEFGFGAAISGNTVLVGARLGDRTGTGPITDSGAAYVYSALRSNGTVCTSTSHCNSGFCVDGVCCNSACGGGVTTDCQACSTAAGAPSNGTCATVTAVSATVCRAAAGTCDVAETCGGTLTTCPTDVFRSAATLCTGSSQGGACNDDAADHCLGTANTCVDMFRSSSTTCGDAGGACINQDFCSGTSAACTDNGFKGSSTLCTGSSQGGVCNNDAADHCSGTNSTCVDIFAVSGTSCRADAGQCDVEEFCTGSSGACPADAFEADTVNCTGTSQGGACDAQDKCLGTANTCGDVYLPTTTSCRADAGQCDVEEFCTGSSGACPADAFEADTVNCTGTSQGGACDAQDKCSGTANTCVDVFAVSGTSCRADAGQCDVEEFCTGSSGTCPADAFEPDTTDCTGTVNGGACNVQDKCSGTANTCVDVFAVSGTSCRADAGQCDVEEFCTGSSGACPADAFEADTVSCTGTSQGGACNTDASDHCSGTNNNCVDVFAGSTTSCRADAGQCDVEEFCTGSSGACPADAFEADTVNCTGTSQGGACDAQDKCSGTSTACVDVFAAAGTNCRADAGQCDVAEECTGSSGACPADAFEPDTTDCTGTVNGGACNVQDKCSGTANTCVDVFAVAGTTCRADAGQCDVAEECTGSSGTCPDDAFEADTVDCTGTVNGGACNVQDKCSGTANTCVDVFAVSGTSCRADAGQCDVEEFCTGSSGTCPADAFEADTVNCTGTVNGGVCNVQDKCSGTANTCVDVFAAPDTSCRADAGQCDVEEFCTGSSGACPADAFEPDTTDCTGTVNGGACNVQDKCSGTANTCVDVFAVAGTSCRADTGQCDVEETCTGSSGACPADAFEPSTTNCNGSSQGGACDAQDKCLGTEDTCVDIFVVSGTTCRGPAGICDVAEECTGSSGACPADDFQSSSVECRPAVVGRCDDGENCTGSSALCPPQDDFSLQLFPPRDTHTETLLNNGKVLIAGGYSGVTLSSAELFDTTTETVSSAGSLGVARRYHTATLLPSGDVLVTGGGGPLASAELFNATTEDFAPTTGSLGTARQQHTATLLNNGKVLIVGGLGNSGSLTSAELYDPTAGTFSLTTNSLGAARYGHSATLLPSGRVLIAGGFDGTNYLNSAEIYNPVTGLFTPVVGTMADARAYHTATLLPNGRVLIAGGSDGSSLTSAEVFVPFAGSFGPTLTPMMVARQNHSATLLPNGKVLLVGGHDGVGYQASAELYDLGSNDFTPTGSLGTSRYVHRATLLPYGNVLISGGYNNDWMTELEIYETTSGTFRHDESFLDDDNACTADACGPSGAIHFPIPIDDFNDCTVDACDPQTGISHTDAAYGTLCGDDDDTDCDNPDICDGFGSCDPNFEPSFTECRSSAGSCDAAENCTGLGACPADAKVPADTECRASAGPCDVHEACDGSSNDCPTDVFAVATTSCTGALQGGDCDDDGGDHCLGTANSCVDAFKDSDTECRESDGQCDVAENCTGSSSACPADAFAVATTSCTGASQVGGCDDNASDHCSGTANSCVDTFKDSDTECRESDGQCDVAENCTGLSGACPVDVFAVPTTSCTGASQVGGCDDNASDHCSGTANSCVDAFKDSDTECRESAGQCDVAENCTGLSGACPVDVFAVATTSCTGALQDGDCDDDDGDHCLGTANTCVDEFKSNSTECRESTGQCDVAENCTGSSSACPTDLFEASTTSCTGTSQIGPCDDNASDHCSGTADECVDAFKDSDTTCRLSGGVCDPAENCTGSTAACPADAKSTDECRGSNGDCDPAEVCDGITNNCPGDAKSTAECRADNGTGCDIAETCDGVNDECPANAFKPAFGMPAFATTTGDLTVARAGHTATLLSSGMVLIAGGQDESLTYLASAELYDPASRTFVPTTNAPGEARYWGSATRLQSGKVLLVGGADGFGAHASAELYDPVTDTFTPTTGAPAVARYFHTATLLPSGEVLIANGTTDGSNFLASAELYDPLTDEFTLTANPPNVARFLGTATLLPTGQVLIAGGASDGSTVETSAELYDPTTDEFTLTTNSLGEARFAHSATLLPSGKVLLLGGGNMVSTALTNAELYDPLTDEFTPTLGSMGMPRYGQTATLLDSDQVLIAGGFNLGGAQLSAELYDPLTESFAPAINGLAEPRYFQTATLLSSGGVLFAGGNGNGFDVAASADVYEPTPTACGDGDDSTCDHADSCDGFGACLVNHTPNTAVCRPDAGDCDVLEKCTGTGSCAAQVFEDEGTTCNDNSASTHTDLCDDSGFCAGTTVTCNPPDQCNTYAPNGTSVCTVTHLTGATCTDADLSTYDDTCSSGGVCAGTPVSCDDNTQCTTYEPNGSSTCTITQSTDGCDDDDDATYDDTCDGSGFCEGTLVVCPDPTQCTTYAPDGDDTCAPTHLTGNTCSDGLLTTHTDTCNSSGACVGTLVVCPDPTQCTTYAADGDDTCAPTHLTGNTCSDGLLTTHTDRCNSSGACVGTPVVCPDPTQCTTYAADGDDTCAPTHLTGTTCSDGSLLTHSDTCNSAGACVGTPVVCPDDTECTTYAPDGDTTCAATFVTGSCSDGNACTVGDSCAAGVCAPGSTPLVCNDGNECTSDPVCVPATGCPTPTPLPSGAFCGDAGSQCTNQDTCNGSGTCVDNGVQSDGTFCGDAGTECTNQDTCNATGSCVDKGFKNPGTFCGDAGAACVNQDTCDGGGLCTDNGFKPDTTACGDQTDDVCNNPNTCSGTDGTCVNRAEPTTTNCGDAAAACVNQDKCDGTGSCQDNGFKSNTTTCGDQTDDVCNNPNTCSGTDGTCVNRAEPTTTNCGDADAECTNQDKCSGTGTCTDNGFKSNTTTCGDQTDDVCNNPNTCSGTDGTCVNRAEPTTTNCGDADAECTNQDKCDGTGSCQDNGFKSNTTTCGDQTDDVCNNPNTCSGTDGTCVNRAEPTTTNCGDADAECTNQDKCDGTGSCTDNGFKANTTPCGDQTDTECTNPDRCSGTSAACLPRHELNTVNCGDADAECTNQDKCSGAGTCTDNGFKANTTPCGDQTDTECTNPDRCSGTSAACLPRHELNTVNCGDADAECTNQDKCSGTGTCTDNGFKANTTPCGDQTDTECTNPDRCSGTSAVCLPRHELNTVNCGDADAECTNQDTCSGTGTCTDNGFKPNTTPCGSSADTDCDNPDTCSGTSAACSPHYELTTVQCRAGVGDCDVAENCDGAGACPADGVEPSTTVCRAANGVCDSEETCDGTTVNCPADAVEPSTTVCRGSAGACDLEELCDGTTKVCPTTDVKSTAECRPASGLCDAAETCDGSGDSCPTDAVQPSTHTCRPATGQCDVAEDCDGSSKACPTNDFVNAGVACGDSSDTECDNPDSCDGAGACASNFVAVSTACGDDNDTECSNPDTCNGSGTCGARHETNGTLCNGGVCAAGLCILEPDAGVDAGADAGPSDAGPRDAAPDDAAVGQGGNPALGGAGGQGGAPIFNLGGDAGVVGGVGGVPQLKPDAGLVDAGFLFVDGGLNPENLPGTCDCSVPGRSSDDHLGFWLAAALLGLAGTRRARSRHAAR